jgi:hypothetical protein
MGHTRLGPIPKTRKWSGVVARITAVNASGPASFPASTEDVRAVSALVLDAAQSGLSSAANDFGLRYAFFLLTQVVLAARHDDWRHRLARLGMHLDDDASFFDLTVELQTAVDAYLFSKNRITDFSEMAQKAAGEALSSLVAPEAETLFDSSTADLRDALRRLSTKAGFADLGQRFFARFAYRFLNFYLSRILATQIGAGRWGNIGDLSEFNSVLARHCEQTARIVHDFCGGWYSKTEFQEGINLENSSRCVAHAVNKLRAELRIQRAEL